MYAVFELSGFQYSAEEGEILKVPAQKVQTGDKIDITNVLLVKDDDNISVGTPYIDDAKIEAEIINSGKNDKVLIYKYKRRTKYRRTQGHRQAYNEIKINKIITS